jgi:rod shape-determining protein MreD
VGAINYLFLPLVLAVAVFQSSAVSRLAIWGVFPNLPLLVVLSWSLLRGARSGLVWSFVAGAMLDLLSGGAFGAATFSLMGVSLLSGVGQARINRGHVFLLLFAGAAATLVYGLVYLLVVRVSGHAVAWLDSLVRILLPTAAMNAVFLPVVYWLLRGLHRRFARETMGF